MSDTHKTTRREVTLPASAFLELLAAARGTDGAAVRERGRVAGAALAERLLSTQDEAPTTRALPTSVFWKRINDLFVARGWGSLTHAPAGQGIGELRSTDWIEAERADRATTCDFTAGVIEGLLGAVSGTRIHVREAECRGAGCSACRFQFGSRAALDATTSSAVSAV